MVIYIYTPTYLLTYFLIPLVTSSLPYFRTYSHTYAHLLTYLPVTPAAVHMFRGSGIDVPPFLLYKNTDIFSENIKVMINSVLDIKWSNLVLALVVLL